MTQSTQSYMLSLGQQAKQSAQAIARASDKQKSLALKTIATELQAQENQLIAANQLDLEAAKKNGLTGPMLDRLTLNSNTIALMAEGLTQIAEMPDPVGELSETKLRPNGMRVSRMRVPLGVIGIIYESRPNVTIDATALCLKSGNAAILRGGSEAIHSNTALANIISYALERADLPKHTVQVVQTTDRDAVGQLVNMIDYVDVIIPRGGKGLIKRLSAEARVPLIKHLDGNCHVYVDEYADLNKAVDIIVNAKTYRYGICGAMESLLIHQNKVAELLPLLLPKLAEHSIELRVCEHLQTLIPNAIAATEEDWYTEYTAPILAIKAVPNLETAIAHIEHYGSHHTDSIVTEHIEHAQRFQREVDSSSVYVNLPTCFADGFEYGLGAEIGISTNKLHARGPVGLEGLTTYKWVLQGEGQLRGQS